MVKRDLISIKDQGGSKLNVVFFLNVFSIFYRVLAFERIFQFVSVEQITWTCGTQVPMLCCLERTTKNRRQRAEARGQRTEGRGHRTEDSDGHTDVNIRPFKELYMVI